MVAGRTIAPTGFSELVDGFGLLVHATAANSVAIVPSNNIARRLCLVVWLFVLPDFIFGSLGRLWKCKASAMNLVIDSQRVAETVTEHARGGVDTLWEQIYRLQGRLPRIR